MLVVEVVLVMVVVVAVLVLSDINCINDCTDK
jgi:hypothetical protein